MSIRESQKKVLLWYRAKKRYGNIQPCSRLEWCDCFTYTMGKLTLWYNVDDSTKIIREGELKNVSNH